MEKVQLHLKRCNKALFQLNQNIYDRLIWTTLGKKTLEYFKKDPYNLQLYEWIARGIPLFTSQEKYEIICIILKNFNNTIDSSNLILKAINNLEKIDELMNSSQRLFSIIDVIYRHLDYYEFKDIKRYIDENSLINDQNSVYFNIFLRQLYYDLKYRTYE